jgi:Transmembrane amino acid transporter protein
MIECRDNRMQTESGVSVWLIALQVLSSGKNKHALFSATATLVLGIMGSAVLIISGKRCPTALLCMSADPADQNRMLSRVCLAFAAAFAVTGICAGVFLLVLIAIVNVYTSDMLIRQCRITGTTDYDTLTYAVGGPIWRVKKPPFLVAVQTGALG